MCIQIQMRVLVGKKRKIKMKISVWLYISLLNNNDRNRLVGFLYQNKNEISYLKMPFNDNTFYFIDKS